MEQTRDAPIHFPQIQKQNDSVSVKESLIVCAAGFEDRTLALGSRIAASECRLGIAVYKDWATNNRLAEIESGYVAAGIDASRMIHFDYDRFEPDEFGADLEAWLTDAPEHCVVLDISTMSRLAIMVAFDACRRSGKEVRIFYAEAQDYGPTLEEYEQAREGLYPRPSIQVYSGLGGVVRSRRLSSVALQGEPTALIAFMSMNEVLTQALINCLCPSRLLLINGRPPGLRWREEATAWIHDELRREWPHEDNAVSASGRVRLPVRSTSTLDYTESVEVLLDLYWDCAAEFRVVLAPTGSKMQTVACSVVKAIHPDIHIEYPTPESFLKEYSRGVGTCWTVDFGCLKSRVTGWRSSIIRDRLLITAEYDG
jgi:hypothetical protein